jgi:two-component system, cell cycle response regulator DivK
MQKGRILIVDDDHRNIFALNAVLKARKFECLTASSAVEGLRKLDEDLSITVVLLDMMMPEMDGYATIRAIRTGHRQDVYIVSVTALAMAGDKEKCLAAGADAYISKPIDIDLLTRLLNEVLN